MGEEAVLPCFVAESEDRDWYIPYISYITIRYIVTSSKNQSEGSGNNTNQRQQAYVEDRREMGKNSLVIPSLTLDHSGYYECCTEYGKAVKLFVCLESEALTEFFSEGEKVILSSNYDLNEGNQVVWFRHTAQHHGVILASSVYTKLPDDMEGRVQLSSPYNTLVLSNLYPQDSGEY